MDKSRAEPRRDRPEDPLYRNTVREAKLILALWGFCFVYTCSYCYLSGYLSHEPDPDAVGPSVAELVGSMPEHNRDPASLSMPFDLGIPDWVFFGVVLPWVACILVTFWFCLFFFREDDLGEAQEDSQGGGTP